MKSNPKTAKSKLGKFMKSIGYLDIRQKFTNKQQTQVFVAHGKHVLAGPFTSHKEAFEEATRMVTFRIRYDKYESNN